MPILELYSTRNKQNHPDTYKYDSISYKLRNQILQIIFDSIGSVSITPGVLNSKNITPPGRIYLKAFNLLRKEYGEQELNGYGVGCPNWVSNLILTEGRVERFLDALELLCTLLLKDVKLNIKIFSQYTCQSPNSAISEINERMKRDGFGYQYLDGIIVRIDQEFLHEEVTKPALFLLTDFDGAREEFISAHEHYRHGRFEECITDCNKSLESLLKEICDRNSWSYKKSKQTVNALIPLCMEKGLFPNYLQTQLSSLSNLVTQGVSTIRNNEAGHGQGPCVRETDEHLVSYALHLTASNIVYLSNCYKNFNCNN